MNNTINTNGNIYKKKIDGTTYIVRAHFNKSAKETLKDKIIRLLKDEVKNA